MIQHSEILNKITYENLKANNIQTNNIRVIIYDDNQDNDDYDENDENQDNDDYDIYFDELINIDNINNQQFNRIYDFLLNTIPNDITITETKLKTYLQNNIYDYNNQYIIYIDIFDPLNDKHTISKTIADEILKSANTTNHSGGGINKKFKVFYNQKNKKYYINYNNRKQYLSYKNIYKDNKNGKFYMKIKNYELEIYI